MIKTSGHYSCLLNEIWSVVGDYCVTKPLETIAASDTPGKPTFGESVLVSWFSKPGPPLQRDVLNFFGMTSITRLVCMVSQILLAIKNIEHTPYGWGFRMSENWVITRISNIHSNPIGKCMTHGKCVTHDLNSTDVLPGTPINPNPITGSGTIMSLNIVSSKLFDFSELQVQPFTMLVAVTFCDESLDNLSITILHPIRWRSTPYHQGNIVILLFC